MNLRRKPAEFVFDFTQADRVSWSHEHQEAGKHSLGRPASFFINDSDVANEFSTLLDSKLADVVDIATAVHMADRLAVRTILASNGWSRRLNLKIAVRRPDVWTDFRVRSCIERLLSFMTEDIWQLEFSALAQKRRSSELQFHLFSSNSQHQSSEIALFSGGLDSLAGVGKAVAQKPRSHFILVSASPNVQQRSRQSRQVATIRRAFGSEISHVCVPLGMHKAEEYSQESSRRTRGFLFLVLGGVTACLAKSSKLHLYENGWGAINLPYDGSQIGTDMSRAVHPRTLREAAELFSLITQSQFSISNECIYETKAEMLRASTIAGIQAAIPFTFSCDGFPVRARGHAHCGFCTSCLLRRQSLEAANLEEFDNNGYLNDWKADRFTLTKHHLHELRAMNWQALRFAACFREQDCFRILVQEFPELRSVVSDLSMMRGETTETVEHSLVRMLRQHVSDWSRFSALRLLDFPNLHVA